MVDKQKLISTWHSAVGVLADTAFKYQSKDPDARRQQAEIALVDMTNEIAQKRGVGTFDEGARDAIKLELAQAFDSKDKVLTGRAHFLKKEGVCHIPEPRPMSLQ